MGFDINTVELLLMAQTQGASFTKVATLGRQEFYRVDGRALQQAFRRWWGIDKSREEADRLLGADGGFADSFLRELGAQEITAIDASPFEGATLLHDMNQRIPDDVQGRFTSVIDGGTLEHVFNFPVAIKNCMQLLQVGGHFITVTPVNNCMGHGFYQFSPELFFRVFCRENGFAVEQMILFESEHNADWYGVADLEGLGRRFQLVNYRPAFLYVQARKEATVPILEVVPQQSDYAASWVRSPQVSAPVGQLSNDQRPGFWIMLHRRAPKWLRTVYQVWRQTRRFHKDEIQKLNRHELIGPHVPHPTSGQPRSS